MRKILLKLIVLGSSSALMGMGSERGYQLSYGPDAPLPEMELEIARPAMVRPEIWQGLSPWLRSRFTVDADDGELGLSLYRQGAGDEHLGLVIRMLPQEMKGAIRILDLRENGLSTLPLEIAELSNVHTINATHNPLVNLPREIMQLSHLFTLYVDPRYANALLYGAPGSMREWLSTKINQRANPKNSRWLAEISEAAAIDRQRREDID